MIPGWLLQDPKLVEHRHYERSAGDTTQWPDWVCPEFRNRLEAAGISRPWLHQRQAADLAWSGRHVAICTPTASGKSLAYLLPVIAATAALPEQVQLGFATRDLRSRLGVARHSALYIAPTKALAHDQRAKAKQLGPPGWIISTLDGDSEAEQRRYARDQATFVLTNPDMLHRSVLPNHARWSRLLGSLRFVVLDEVHRYRGVFGAHVSAVIRRLRRLANAHGADPVFILSSATSTNAGESGATLIGEPGPLAEVSVNAAQHPARDILLWRPGEDMITETSGLLAHLVDAGIQTIAFVPSRKQAELVALGAQESQETNRWIASYRAGYLASDRRDLEAGLRSGALSGVAATNALELGVDISGLDAVLIAGFPGTVASFWQQSGRAGRSDQDALVVLLAKDDPLDAHLFAHPEMIFERAAEQTVLHPANRYVLAPHLAAAAQEAPLTKADERWFGPSMTRLADELAGQQVLRRRASGWFWPHAQRAVDAIDLRAASGKPVEIIDEVSGQVIGSVDAQAADRTVHTGAVYLHQGEHWLVVGYLPKERLAMVRRFEATYYTQALATSQVSIIEATAEAECGQVPVSFGEVEISTQVTGYLRRDALSGQVWDQTPLELPSQRMRTQSMWWPVPNWLTTRLGLSADLLASAAHALEHTAIGLLPAFAPCDRWDIGGLSTTWHPDTGVATIFIHDGAAGGAGFAEHGFRVAQQWLQASAERLGGCSCEDGCPLCVVSPKCGNGNTLLDKAAGHALALGMLGLTG